MVGRNASELSQEELYQLFHGRRARRDRSGAADQKHAFWDTQPVPRIDAEVREHGPLLEQTAEDIRKEPYGMAAGYEWSVVDILDDVQATEVYTLLTNNYVEDDDNMFRFDYSVPFLRWALTPPNFSPDLHLGVRSTKTGKLMAFISGVPADMRVYQTATPMVEINFLCVHKLLRSKRLAPMLIKEITRRVNTQGIFQAVYTAGVVLPKPVAQCRYYHRSLDPKKLIEVGFSRLMPRMTMTRTMRLFKLPDQPQIPGIQPMLPEHCESARNLLNQYLSQFKMAPHLSTGEFTHQLTPREGVIDSFVVLDESGVVTDLCSFYHLPSTVMRNDKHNKLYAAYSFYNVATTVTMKVLMEDALVLAKHRGMDVFNALDVMHNESFLKELKFGIGDGHLQYYLYNWKCPDMQPQDVGLVLL